MNDVFMKTYNRLPVTFAKGNGAWLTDINNKKYLDFTSGIAVNCLGHGYPELVDAISTQASRINHVCNYYTADTSSIFAEKLIAACSASGMKRVFLANSGAEANEGACKIARKYSLVKYGKGRHTIVSLLGSFHGRTITTLSATGQEHFHKDFGPYTEGFVFIPPGDIEALERALDKKTVAALLIEPIQGESGIKPQTQEYMEMAAKLCEERDILLIMDEIQTGVGRTGYFLASEAYGLKPDIVTLAKGLGGGVPVGAVMAGERTEDVLQPGDHGSTFGGNLLAASAGIVVLDTITKKGFMEDISRKGSKIKEIISSWKDSGIKEIRGIGLMLGVDISKEAWPILEEALKKEPGLLLLTAGKQTLRLLPPYIISDGELEQGLDIMKSLL